MIEKTIFLTGANGLLGQKLVEKLSRRKAIRLIASSRGPNRNRHRDDYTYVSLDIRDTERMRELFREYQPSELINAAAMTQVDACEEERELCKELNVTAVANMAALCREFGVKMVHVSTDFIFDGEDGPYNEKATPRPLSYYGESKLLSEQAVIEAGIPFAIVRTVLVYGVVADKSRGNIVLWAKNALEKGQAINVVDDQHRSPTLSEDLADGIILIVMKEKNGIYNISGPETMSVLEIVEAVAEHWGLDKSLITPVSTSTLNQKAPRPPKTGFILIKAQTELGYKPHTFREGLQIVERQLDKR